jgi:capsular exopolysaccharide synthesis family protein
MAQETQEIDIRTWIIRIVRNWYWFLLSCILFGALGVYTYFATTSKYTVDAKLMIRNNDSESPLGQMEMLSMLGMGGTKQIEDEVAILTSRDILTQVVRELDLQSEYRKKRKLKWVGQYPSRDLTVVYPEMFLDTTKKPVQVQIKARKNNYLVKVKYGRWDFSRHKVNDLTQPFSTCAGDIAFQLNKPIQQGAEYTIMTLPMLPAVDKYNRAIVAAPYKKESNIINISTSTDMPQRAIDFINKEIEFYNLDAVIDKNIMASNTASFIEERLRLIEAELAVAESELEAYKAENGIVDLLTEAELYLHEGAEYKKQLAEIETQINLIQYIAEYVSDESKKNALIPANLGIDDQALVALIAEYNQQMLKRMRVQRTATNSNPVLSQMDNQLAMLRENIITSIHSISKSLTIAKKDAEVRQGKINVQRYNIPTQEKEYIEVARTRELKEQLYLFLYEKREENALTLASTVMPAKIIASPQMDPNSTSPSIKIIGIICLVLGFGVPIGVIYLYHFFNNKLSDDSREFERKIKMPFGGVLVQNHHGEHIAVKEGVNSASAELFRLLRSNLRFMLPSHATNPVILVTSNINGEGKSYVATNLAISLALLDKKVALVGLDIRKPMLAQYLNLPSQGCLTSYLSDDAYSIDDLVIPSETKGLDILPAGIIPPNPNELLLSDRLDQLFVELRQRYDYIVVDSAPVALISDTFQLNRVADMTVYVCRARYTTFDLIDYLNQVHEQKRLPNIVTVLNGVNGGKAGYGYGYGYGANNSKH